MSRRLQVVVDDDELQGYEMSANALGLTLSGWVRQSLRNAQKQESSSDVDSKLNAVRRAFAYSFPAPDIDTMLAEIEKGYGSPEQS